jgi:murein DD-endopeptidase MepM/ murein hydrolase activator NlpD
VLALALTTSMVGLGWLSPAAQAQTDPTTTTPPPTVAKATTTTTTTKPRGPTTTAAPTTTSTLPPTTTATTFPSGLQAIANAVKRSPPSNDAALMKALAPLQQMGMTAQQAMLVGMGQFPLAGPAFYTDDWLEPRPGNPPRLHLGDDIVAPLGTPIRAPIDGVLKYDFSDPAGYGVAAIVTGPDKTFYLNGHLSATITGLATGSPVQQGQVIGLVGATGDATGPHDHFEVHPFGGAGVDPKPVLDAWQAAAIKAIPALVIALKGEPVTTVAAVAPLQVALPAPQSAFSPPLAPLLTSPINHQGSLAGLALVGLLALLASSGLAVNRFRPPWPLRWGRGGPPEGRPTPAR